MHAPTVGRSVFTAWRARAASAGPRAAAGLAGAIKITTLEKTA